MVKRTEVVLPEHGPAATLGGCQRGTLVMISDEVFCRLDLVVDGACDGRVHVVSLQDGHLADLPRGLPVVPVKRITVEV